jgi:hypothetical protein
MQEETGRRSSLTRVESGPRFGGGFLLTTKSHVETRVGPISSVGKIQDKLVLF